MPNTLDQYYVAPSAPVPDPVILGLEPTLLIDVYDYSPFATEAELLVTPAIGVELINDETYETEVGQSLTTMLRGIDTHYLFPTVENDLATV